MRSLYLLRSYGTAGLDGEQLVVRCAGEEIERVRLPLLVDPFNVWLIRIRRIRADPMAGKDHAGNLSMGWCGPSFGSCMRPWMDWWCPSAVEPWQTSSSG